MKKLFISSLIFTSLNASTEFNSTNLISETTYEMLPYEISAPANQNDFFGFFDKYMSTNLDTIKSSFMNSQFYCGITFYDPNTDKYKTEVSRDVTSSYPYKVVFSTNPTMIQGYTEKCEKNISQNFEIGNFSYSAILTDINNDLTQHISEASIPSLAKHEFEYIKLLSTKTIKIANDQNVSLYDFIDNDANSIDNLRTIFSPSYISISKWENNNLENLIQNSNFLTRSDEGKVTLKIQDSDKEIIHSKGFVAFSQNQNAWVMINNWENPSKDDNSSAKRGICISKLQVYSDGYRSSSSCDFTKDGKLINYDLTIER